MRITQDVVGGFGAVQGSGQVWLGTANGVVQTWSNTLITAQVAAGSASGVAQVMQGGVWSPSILFTVNSLHITSESPASGVAGTPVTIIGTGFGSTQGTGAVVLGSLAGQVSSWNDTQVTANVSVGSVTGLARIQQNGVWSNALSFVVNGSGGSAAKLAPNLMNMLVGDTRTIQALNAAGQPLTGLTWTSSDPAAVSVSTADPRVLSALAVGHVTITAGGASADVTVSAGPLPVGTVLWSNAGNVNSIVPAVPSASGVADVFAFQSDGTVQAITSDGTVAWTANVGQTAQILPDFQGGLVIFQGNGNIFKLDGLTGQAYPAYVSGSSNEGIAVHTDGTIFSLERDLSPPYTATVFGIDPTTGTQKFSVQAILRTGGETKGPPLIAGDGYAYIPYATMNYGCGANCQINHLKLLRVNSAGASDVISIKEWSTVIAERIPVAVAMITNADTGILMTIRADGFYTATVSGNSVSVVSAQPFPGQDAIPYFPVLQAQDGSFIGTVYDNQSNMVAFDGSGALRWSVPNETPMIATADGGVIGSSGITYDQNGNATGQSSLNASQSPGWLGNVLSTAYSVNSGMISSVSSLSTKYATTFAAFLGGNASGQGTAIQQVMTKLPQTGAKQLPNLGIPPVCYPLPVGTSGFTPTCGNINAIELLTSASLDSIFQSIIQTFAPVTRTGPNLVSPNPLMTFTGPGNTNTINVTGPGQTLTISLTGFASILQNAFAVMTERFDPAAHTISVVTLAGHPLAGWRYWRVYSIGTNDVVIETGAYDQPAPGLLNYAGYYVAKGMVLQGWQKYLEYIKIRLNAPQGVNLQNSQGGINLRNYLWTDGTLLNGYWDYFGDFTQYILNNVCQSATCN